MCVEDQTCTYDISQDCPCDNRADITIEVGKETDIDSEVHDQEYSEILDDAIVSNLFKQQNIRYEYDNDRSIEEVIDTCKSSDVSDIIIDQCDDDSYIHELQNLLCSIGHLHHEGIDSFLQLRRKRSFVLGDSFSCQYPSHRNICLLLIRKGLMSEDITYPYKSAREQETIQCQSNIEIMHLMDDDETESSQRQYAKLVSKIIFYLFFESNHEDQKARHSQLKYPE